VVLPGVMGEPWHDPPGEPGQSVSREAAKARSQRDYLASSRLRGSLSLATAAGERLTRMVLKRLAAKATNPGFQLVPTPAFAWSFLER